MRAVDIIRRKRDGLALDDAEIEAFAHGVTAREWPDYQASALLMAICLRGMTPAETDCLTRAMVQSGERLDLSDIPGPKVDKHSTGGVGDKTSLILAPLAATCGVIVPKMSGRSLGHSGGTLDKLEAIPGFRVGLSLAEFRAALRKVGYPRRRSLRIRSCLASYSRTGYAQSVALPAFTSMAGPASRAIGVASLFLPPSAAMSSAGGHCGAGHVSLGPTQLLSLVGILPKCCSRNK